MKNRYPTRRCLLLAFVFTLALAGALALLDGARATSAGVNLVKIGLVTDGPTLLDKSFNQMSYEGLLRAESELGVVGTVYTSTDAASIQASMEQCAADGNALCISVAFLTSEAISNTAPLFPGTHFAILDFTFEEYPANLRGIGFASQEAAYLAGTLAGQMTELDVLGVVSGMPIPTVDSFIKGFARGAACANPDVTTLITYTNDFANPELGSQVALDLLAQNADVIFGVAGQTGYGTILTATQAGAWAIGVDNDQYETVFEGGGVNGSEYLLTSAMKRLDNAVFMTISDEVHGSFTPGTLVYNLASDGVGLAPYHEADPAIPVAAKDAVEAARQGILAGTINPYGPCQVFTDHVGLVTDNPNLMDGGFNEMSYQGLLRAQNELGVVGKVYTSTEPGGSDENLHQCALDGNAVCFMVGFTGAEAISTAAQIYPEVKFVILDYAFENYPDNLQGAVFAAEEAGYLAGTLAGKMTESDLLGVVGGMPIPGVDAFIDGYAQGAACVNPQVTTLVSYAGTFADPLLGAQLAQSLLDSGADIIFAVAGETGNGSILTATQSGAWAIGVDADQYLTVFEGGTVPGADLLLTSAMKRLDNSVFQVVSETLSASFSPGTVVYDLAKGGVDLAPYHTADASIPASAKAAVEAARSGLLDGSIDPYGPCPATKYYAYLPIGGKSWSP